jgi:WbqC-like protein family
MIVMKIAIMQPYFLPYIGYFQLISSVDKFIILDDVNYINRGWINRNRLLLNGVPHTFSIPLSQASQNRLISDIQLIEDGQWRYKLLQTIRQAYIRSPNYLELVSMIQDIVNYKESQLNKFLLHSLRKIIDYLEIKTEIIDSSTIYGNSLLRGQNRIIDICKQEGATTYINPIGGKALYQKDEFSKCGINLHFLSSSSLFYKQWPGDFVPSLSILDGLMFNKKIDLQRLLHIRDIS